MKLLTDTHCHLSLDQFSNELDEIIKRAQAAGIGRIVIPGIDLTTSELAVEIAEGNEGVFASVGVHPHNADAYSEEVRDQLRDLAHSPDVVAIGEIGLDFYRDLSPRDRQRAVMRDQLKLARELELPVIIHNREAHEDLFEVLLEWAPTVDRPRRGVLHAFSGTHADAQVALSSGFFIGVAGPLTYPSAEDLRQTIKQLPLDGLLLETDAPYLPPQPHRGKRNEPAYLPIIAEELGKLKERDITRVIDVTSMNADKLFNWSNGSANAILS